MTHLDPITLSRGKLREVARIATPDTRVTPPRRHPTPYRIVLDFL